MATVRLGYYVGRFEPWQIVQPQASFLAVWVSVLIGLDVLASLDRKDSYGIFHAHKPRNRLGQFEHLKRVVDSLKPLVVLGFACAVMGVSAHA